MEDNEQRRLESEFKRIRHLRTGNPFCRICGKSLLWARYERHHVDLKAYSSDELFICEDCHRELHAMLNDFPRIPYNVPKSRHWLIHMARGQIAIARLSKKKWGEVEEWLLNAVDLPPAPDAIENGEEGAAAEACDRPHIIADLEARFGQPGEESSK